MCAQHKISIAYCVLNIITLVQVQCPVYAYIHTMHCTSLGRIICNQIQVFIIIFWREAAAALDTLVAIISFQKPLSKCCKLTVLHSTRCYLATRIVSYADSLWPALVFGCVCNVRVCVCVSVGHSKFGPYVVSRLYRLSRCLFFEWPKRETFVVFLPFPLSLPHLRSNHAQLEHIILEAGCSIASGTHTSSNCYNNFNALRPI